MPEGSHSAAHDVAVVKDSVRLSSASVSSSDRASTATLSDCSDFPSGPRPVSLVSTVSSGSGSSRDELAAPGSGLGGPPCDDDLELELCPSGEVNPDQMLIQLSGSTLVNSSHPSLSPFAAKAMAPNPQLTYLDRVVMEILETERMYVRDLRSIVEDYLAYIIDSVDLPIVPEQVCALFGNIEDIYEFNSELLQALDMCESDPVAIAHCFVLKSEYFEIYTQYCTNYPNSVAALTDCMRNKTLAKFFRERQAALKHSLPLGSYLLKPVQRILKYHLLLQEIAKHFDPEEEGYEVVEEAIYTMTGVAWYINDMKRKHEHAVRLQEVQSLLISWKGPDLTTYGELVLEGNFRLHRAKNERTLFLFDRMLLITKRRGEHYVYKTHISCSTLMLIESAKDSLCFSVTHYKHPKQPYTVQAKTAEERKLWAHHIKRLILENHQAVIPQKAKEAILEMDSIYPPKYKYSPERMKKAMGLQSGDGHRGQRRSELSKLVAKSIKAALKHGESDGELSADGEPVEAISAIGAIDSSEPEAERPAVVDNTEEGQTSSDKEEVSDCSSVTIQKEENDADSGSDDILMESDQDEEGCDFIRNNCKNVNGQSAGLDNSNATEVQLSPEQSAVNTTQIQNNATQRSSTKALQLSFTPDSEPSVAEAVLKADDIKDEEGKEKANEDPPALQQDAVTPAESSEEEEEEEDEVGRDMQSSSILPSSVLDKASAIAEHFSSTVRRSSLAADETQPAGCQSSHLPSRTGSSLSLFHVGSSSSELGHEALTAAADMSYLSPREDNLFDSEQTCRRRDSILSKQDQLLINKIKSYYENAEHQDVNFSLKRRESLTYIPSGLVRSSVSRFNSIPKDGSLSLDRDSAAAVGMVSGPAALSSHMVSSMSTNSFGSERSKGTDMFSSNVDSTADVHTDEKQCESPHEEIFRPSAEMIKVWQDMEKDVSSPQTDHKATRSREMLRFRGASPSFPRRNQPLCKNTETLNRESLMVTDDLSTITEESPAQSERKATGLSLNQTVRPEEKTNAGPPSTVNVELAQNKVFHLARKFSQRTKSIDPVVRQRSAETMFTKCSLPSVMEEKLEKESKGKPNLTLPLSLCGLVTLPDQTTHSDSSCIAHGSSSSSQLRVLSPRSRSRSPLTPPPAEGFNWPDVRELRSKYSALDSSLPPAARSHSVPDRMSDSGLRRRSSCSSRISSANAETPRRDSENSRLRPHRAGSLDLKLGGLCLSDLPGEDSSYYISAQTTLPNDKKVIVVEKILDTIEDSDKAAEREQDEAEEHYVQIRSPTSREKISIMSVIDRCRAYQDTEEYRQREDAPSRSEASLKMDRSKDPSKTSVCSDRLDNILRNAVDSGKKADVSQQSVVKNLREKFLNLR